MLLHLEFILLKERYIFFFFSSQAALAALKDAFFSRNGTLTIAHLIPLSRVCLGLRDVKGFAQRFSVGGFVASLPCTAPESAGSKGFVLSSHQTMLPFTRDQNSTEPGGNSLTHWTVCVKTSCRVRTDTISIAFVISK